ncbi:hypothetical protein EV361DRAFT_949357 [Lentinula raphanica]|nr:hypothetical protein EV361DRAFT_949357 [Lentinula raphanica]
MMLNKDALRLQVLADILGELSLHDSTLAYSLTELHLGGDPVNSLLEKLLNDPVIEAKISQEIDARIASISTFFGGDSEVNPLERIREEIENIASLESELSSSRSTVTGLITRVNKLHTTLHKELLNAIATIPPSLNDEHKARNALLAATIEASLVKLSLMKAQAHKEVYEFVSDTRPEATMMNALSNAYGRLKSEAECLMDEEQVLDSQIEEYTRLMQLVEGGSGQDGFGQIVEDYLRVEKETEECKRDLRRLGWTEFDGQTL